MASKWMRRSLLAAVVASTALLSACGSSDVASAISPTRFVVFGDALADAGQKGSAYSVNNGSINNWTVQLANRYDVKLKAVSAGGSSYAQGNARITGTPDPTGNATTPTVTKQIDTFLASGKFNGNDDVVVVNAGVSDVIYNTQKFLSGEITEDALMANATQAGADLAAQVRRLVNAGAAHVIVAGSYDLSRSPWAIGLNKETLLSTVSMKLNNTLKINIEDMGKHVLYVDIAYRYNQFQGNPGGWGFSDGTTPVCTSVDASNGIGIGTNQVNSSLCTASTLLAADTNVDKYVFADKIYLTPYANRQFGDYAYDVLRQRW